LLAALSKSSARVVRSEPARPPSTVAMLAVLPVRAWVPYGTQVCRMSFGDDVGSNLVRGTAAELAETRGTDTASSYSLHATLSRWKRCRDYPAFEKVVMVVGQCDLQSRWLLCVPMLA